MFVFPLRTKIWIHVWEKWNQILLKCNQAKLIAVSSPDKYPTRAVAWSVRVGEGPGWHSRDLNPNPLFPCPLCYLAIFFHIKENTSERADFKARWSELSWSGHTQPDQALNLWDNCYSWQNLERQKTINISLSFSSVTNIIRNRMKSALSNVVALFHLCGC